MTSERFPFDKRRLEELPPAPKGKRTYYYDTKVGSLQLQVTDNGVKTFYLYRRINGRPTRHKLGRLEDFQNMTRVRQKAEGLRGEMAQGKDIRTPQSAKDAKRLTLREAHDEYLAARKSLKASTVKHYNQFQRTAFADWQTLPLAELTKDAISRRHSKLGAANGGPYADGAMRYLRAVYNHAMALHEDRDGNSLLPNNPVQRLSQARAWYKPKRRTNWIRPDQLPAWTAAVLAFQAEPVGTIEADVADYLLLIVLTGLRKSEAAGLTWDDVNLTDRTLTLRDTKNSDDHMLPLSDYLSDLLNRRAQDKRSPVWVFPNRFATGPLVEPRGPVNRIKEESGVAFTLHDLRRTFTTYAERAEISAYALKRLLNHKMSNDVTAGYLMTDVERLRQPIQQITDLILSLGNARPGSTLVPFSAAKGVRHDGR